MLRRFYQWVRSFFSGPRGIPASPYDLILKEVETEMSRLMDKYRRVKRAA